MRRMSRYLLIIGCSQKKNSSLSAMKALDRYDGVNFRVLKKFRRERTLPHDLDIVIISAKYGFLNADDYTEDYNMRMTPQRALILHDRIIGELNQLLREKAYEEIFINLGKDYLPAIEGLDSIVTCPVTYAEGRIGEKMSAMKRWITRIALMSDDQKTLTDLLL